MLRSELPALRCRRSGGIERALGCARYPGFSYLRTRRRRNPAEVLLAELNQPDLDARVTEGLPWLALTYVDMDWDWLVRSAKLGDRQNRLGFAVSLASELAEGKHNNERARRVLATLRRFGKRAG